MLLSRQPVGLSVVASVRPSPQHIMFLIGVDEQFYSKNLCGYGLNVFILVSLRRSSYVYW